MNKDVTICKTTFLKKVKNAFIWAWHIIANISSMKPNRIGNFRGVTQKSVNKLSVDNYTRSSDQIFLNWICLYHLLKTYIYFTYIMQLGYAFHCKQDIICNKYAAWVSHWYTCQLTIEQKGIHQRKVCHTWSTNHKHARIILKTRHSQS